MLTEPKDSASTCATCVVVNRVEEQSSGHSPRCSCGAQVVAEGTGLDWPE